jgi:hypothetical protein
MEWLKRIFKTKEKAKARPMVIEGFSGRPLSEISQGKLGAIIQKNKCPDCGSKGFYEGPSGGVSTNIYCTNPECRSAFNYTNIFGEGHAERIGRAPGHVYER